MEFLDRNNYRKIIRNTFNTFKYDESLANDIFEFLYIQTNEIKIYIDLLLNLVDFDNKQSYNIFIKKLSIILPASIQQIPEFKTIKDVNIYLKTIFNKIDGDITILKQNLINYIKQYFIDNNHSVIISYINNNIIKLDDDQIVLITNMLKNERLPFIDAFMGPEDEPKLIFEKNIQQLLFNHFKNDKYLLIGGGTGVGKTAVVPILLFYYMKSINNNSRIKMIISEPRIATVKNPYEYMRKNIGQYDKITIKQEIKNQLCDNPIAKNKQDLDKLLQICIRNKSIE